MSNSWEEYIRLNFLAHKNIVRILRNEGAKVDPTYDPETMAEYRLTFQEEINMNTRTGIIKAHQKPHVIELPNGLKIVIIFISSDLTRPKIKDSTIRPHLLNFLSFGGIEGESNFESISLVRNIKGILISYSPLSGNAHNKILEYNTRLEYPIRHFTLAELQFDPTEHRMGPKSMILATPEEVETLIKKQRGLKIGRDRLIPEFEERLEDIIDPNEKAEFKQLTDEEILSKQPTLNSSDPWVKWKGFKIGDVVKIERRIGQSKFTYRRVVLVERIAPKAAGTKKPTTNK